MVFILLAWRMFQVLIFNLFQQIGKHEPKYCLNTLKTPSIFRNYLENRKLGNSVTRVGRVCRELTKLNLLQWSHNKCLRTVSNEI